MSAALDRTTLQEMKALCDEWWSMSWWDQTGRRGDDWEGRMDALNHRMIAAGQEPMW